MHPTKQRNLKIKVFMLGSMLLHVAVEILQQLDPKLKEVRRRTELMFDSRCPVLYLSRTHAIISLTMKLEGEQLSGQAGNNKKRGRTESKSPGIGI